LRVFLSFVFPLGLSPLSTLFPYTTLFRSRGPANGGGRQVRFRIDQSPVLAVRQQAERHACRAQQAIQFGEGRCLPAPGLRFRLRSEEHTSELQSREKLVCRLLLEKKKSTK